MTYESPIRSWRYNHGPHHLAAQSCQIQVVRGNVLDRGEPHHPLQPELVMDPHIGIVDNTADSLQVISCFVSSYP